MPLLSALQLSDDDVERGDVIGHAGANCAGGITIRLLSNWAFTGLAIDQEGEALAHVNALSKARAMIARGATP